MHCRMLYGFWMSALVIATAAGAANRLPQSLLIPDKTASAVQRRITVEDMSALRRIDTLKLSPDRQRFAILVRQADASANSYRTGWFVGDIQGGRLIPVGNGGEARLAIAVTQRYGGSFDRPAVRWSADGRWIAYTLLREGEIQLWRSRTDGSAQEQLTRNASDVREFEWSGDGKLLYFTAGTPRDQLRARQEAKQRNGYHYDTELNGFTDLMALPAPSMEKDAAVWIVNSDKRRERLASATEVAEFRRAQGLSGDGFKVVGLAGAFAERADGAQARAVVDRTSLKSRVEVTLPGVSNPIQCTAELCNGFVEKLWWGDDTVLFLSREGIAGSATSLYAWTPATGATSVVTHTLDDFLQQCELAAGMRLVCVRETLSLPAHVAAVDRHSGVMQLIANVNPEFQNIALGKVERFEWQTPRFKWNEPGDELAGVYPDRAYGYVLYPPDFDAAKKYPVFMSPYAASGFDNLTNQEYPLHVFAANGFVVLSTNFPTAARDIAARVGPNFSKLLYSAELGFPHLTMYMESTVHALDAIAARGFIDERRVGIGGVSHGAFVPLYLVQKYDRIAAVSVSGGVWSQLEYYWQTPRGRQAGVASANWFVKPVGPGFDFWKQIELADNVETIEAPILINTPATETYSLIRLLKHMAEAGKPYDAYVFPNETHLKWQAAHLYAIMQRNVDWFRFWLQAYEDPVPGKAEQYARWRKLRELASPAAAISRPQGKP